jgi:hypothetical protein
VLTFGALNDDLSRTRTENAVSHSKTSLSTPGSTFLDPFPAVREESCGGPMGSRKLGIEGGDSFADTLLRSALLHDYRRFEIRDGFVQ